MVRRGGGGWQTRVEQGESGGGGFDLLESQKTALLNVQCHMKYLKASKIADFVCMRVTLHGLIHTNTEKSADLFKRIYYIS